MKRCFVVFMTMVMLVFGSSMNAITVYAAEYGNSWEEWKMDQSDYKDMRKYGCRVMAYAKMLSEIGMNSFGTPDDLYEWGVENGKFAGSITEKGKFGTMLMDYVKASGGTISKNTYTLSSDRKADCEKIMNLLEQGYSCFLVCNAHTVYIGTAESLDQGTPVIMDGNGAQKLYKNYKKYSFVYLQYFEVDQGQNFTTPCEHMYEFCSEVQAATCLADGTAKYECRKCGDSYYDLIPSTGHNYTTSVIEPTYTEEGYTLHCCLVCGDCYKDNYLDRLEAYVTPESDNAQDSGCNERNNEAEASDDTSAQAEEPIVTYDSISISNITATGALIKACVTADCTQLKDAGMEWGYLINGMESSRTEFAWPTGKKLTYISVDFGTERDVTGNVPVLQAESSVYCRFFVTGKDGRRIYSATQNFMTGTPDENDEGDKDIISYDKITITNVKSSSAFVKANVTADCTQLKNAGMEWGYVVDGVEIPQTEFRWATGKKLTYISVDFGKEKDKSGNIPVLQSQSTVYCRFFVTKKDGKRVYSDKKYLKTS